MERHILGIIGGALIVIGLIGIAFVGFVIATSPNSVDPSAAPPGLMRRGLPAPGQYASAGQRIFLSGVGHAGPIPRTGGFGMMASGGCAACHGADGRGGTIGRMMGGGVDTPDIRFSTLASPHSEEGTTEPGWTEAQIAAAIRDGADPSGGSLTSFMPRWQMDDQDMADLIAYLKQL